MEINNFGLNYETPSDAHDDTEKQLLTRLDHVLADLQQLRDHKQAHTLTAESSDSVQFRQTMYQIEADIRAVMRDATEAITEATISEYTSFDEARQLLETARIPVDAEPSAMYEQTLERLTIGTSIQLRTRTNQAPTTVLIHDTPILFLMPTHREDAMRAAIYLPVAYEDGFIDSEIIYPHYDQKTGQITTQGITTTT